MSRHRHTTIVFEERQPQDDSFQQRHRHKTIVFNSDIGTRRQFSTERQAQEDIVFKRDRHTTIVFKRDRHKTIVFEQ